MTESGPGMQAGPVVLGRIADAYGIQGWVRIHAYGDDPAAWRQVREWCFLDPDGKPRGDKRRLMHLRAQQGSVVAQFEGVADRTAAEALKGLLLAVDRVDLPSTSADEFYWVDLVGLNVVNRDGEPLGSVADMMETGANAVMVVRADGQTDRLIPFAKGVVDSVADGRVVVDWGRDW